MTKHVTITLPTGTVGVSTGAGNAIKLEPRQAHKLAMDIIQALRSTQTSLEAPISDIETILTISTAHVTPETIDALNNEEDRMPITFRKGDYGYLIYLGNEPSDTSEEFDGEDVEERPADLVRLMTIGREHGYTWLCLDRDADALAGVPTYDW